jgi:beta-phosphoglucomutase-like phosphatase (HAD superfamily)
MFLTAAEELGVGPSTAIVLEDAAAGVEAAKAGGMAAIVPPDVDLPLRSRVGEVTDVAGVPFQLELMPA